MDDNTNTISDATTKTLTEEQGQAALDALWEYRESLPLALGIIHTIWAIEQILPGYMKHGECEEGTNAVLATALDAVQFIGMKMSKR